MTFWVILIVFIIIVLIGGFLDNKEKDKKSLENHSDFNTRSSYSSYTTSKNDKPHQDSFDRIRIVGGFYRSFEAKRYIRLLNENDIVYFKDEPDNIYDPNAIMVISSNGLHLGYVSKSFIDFVKSQKVEKAICGKICVAPDSRYEFFVTLSEVDDMFSYHEAITKFLEKSRLEEETKALHEKRDKADFYNTIILANKYVEEKKYASVYNMISKFFTMGIEDKSCYELMIKACHYTKDYQKEHEYIDKYIELYPNIDLSSINRRKYHILRAMGILTSNDQIINEKAGVETTILELDFFIRIVDRLSDDVDPNRIDFRDSKTLFAINLDNNTRRPICKLYLNNPSKMFIGLMNDDLSVLKVPINDVSEIDDIKDDLLRPIKQYI